ncbi:purple acid phosphatase family protein [Schlesneria sp. DSM 10557]|uniref:purple acid phosphatase family protein n=1 Tax=Schlesneria sp. DSM 10557 TaxID=3044399 RepID=UPI0035A1C9A0
MSPLNRRSFLSTSLGGLAAASACRPSLLAQDSISPAEASNPAASFEPDTLFLTWQRDPTSTITIQWLGAETSADTSIQFATLDAPVWQIAMTITRPYTNTDLKVFRCELTGLQPGQEYQFQVANAAEVYRFRTMPGKATDTFQFVSGGDSGVGLHAINTNILAARQEPYFALIAGDLAYDNGRSPETFAKYLQNYHEHMIDAQGRLIPMVAAIGNHEVDGGYKRQRQDAPAYLSFFDGFYPEKTYGVLDIGDYLSLVVLDTDHIAPIAGEQTDWLRQTLADRQERPHLIVANHVPAYPSYRSPQGANDHLGTGEEQRKHWCPLFEQYNVDVVLEHHDHTFKRTHPLTNGLRDKHGVLYLGDGSWGQLRVPKTPEERPYLAAVSSAYHMTVHRLEGDQRFHMAMEQSGKIADVCMTTSKRPAKRG